MKPTRLNRAFQFALDYFKTTKRYIRSFVKAPRLWHHSRCVTQALQPLKSLQLEILFDNLFILTATTLRWRQNGRDSVSNHQPHDCLLNRLFRRRSKKTSKLRVTGLCAGNSPGTGKFPAQMASYAENVSIWWRHHGTHQSFTLPTLHVSKRNPLVTGVFPSQSSINAERFSMSWGQHDNVTSCTHRVERIGLI